MGPTTRSHYDVLGVPRRASTDEIRRAYRELARQVHPDRAPGAGGVSAGRTMAEVNEAYRVLSDPARRVVYDRTLDATEVGSARPPESWADRGDPVEYETPPPPRHTVLSPPGPARVPWKLMLVLAGIGSGAVILSSAFDDPTAVQPPDGILQLGSCIVIEPNGDAREVACTGTADDVVVEVMVPLDRPCPAGSTPHRDRLGIVVVCVPDNPSQS